MNKKIIFITGGARSGKSRFAEELARQFPGAKAYLATAQGLDEEMADRIRLSFPGPGRRPIRGWDCGIT